jgi:hypothetical protein
MILGCLVSIISAQNGGDEENIVIAIGHRSIRQFALTFLGMRGKARAPFSWSPP